jgi:hypothetical protein
MPYLILLFLLLLLLLLRLLLLLLLLLLLYDSYMIPIIRSALRSKDTVYSARSTQRNKS